MSVVLLLYDLSLFITEAKPLYQWALAIREKALGAEHSDVAALPRWPG
jgi:hypothetical protein